MKCNVGGTQITVSEGHPWPKLAAKGEDIGGNFYSINRRFIDQGRRSGDITSSERREELQNPEFRLYDKSVTGTTSRYYGPIYPVLCANDSGTVDSFWPEDLSSSDEDLDAMGATAIARCKPTNSSANISTTMAELIREGLPSMIGSHLWESRLRDVSSLGKESLNYQFGIRPLLDEIKGTSKAIANWDSLIKQYRRDAGRIVRRSYEFPTERETTVEDITPTTLSLKPLMGTRSLDDAFSTVLPSARRLYREREIVRKTWFSGAFTYYMPTDFKSFSNVEKTIYYAQRLLGVELTPEVLWNLAPWSWAVDWFSNVGDVLDTASDFITDGLVVRWGYLMENTIVTDTYTMTNPGIKGHGLSTLSCAFETNVKKRRRATPFGFGLDFDGFDPFQLGIIASLGISKIR